MADFVHRPVLKYDAAARVVAEAITIARSRGLEVCVSVVDDGGHLLAFGRMDEAMRPPGDLSTAKAVTAALIGQPTTVVSEAERATLATMSGGLVCSLPGGVPVVVDGLVAGAVGVGGATPEQDDAIARESLRAIPDADAFEALPRD